MTNNDERTKRVEKSLLLYPEDRRTNLIDFLADAMHWCRKNDVGFDDVLQTSRMHFEAEEAGEE